MIEILRKAGAPVDDRKGGRNSAAYVLVTAEDGYRAVYALAEIDPAYALERQVVVADTLDGKPLSGKFGNLRIVNKGEVASRAGCVRSRGSKCGWRSRSEVPDAGLSYSEYR